MDARNFLLSTDYPMPVICWEKSGSVSNISAYAIKSTTVAHGLPFTPLIIGIWSESSNFTPCYDISNNMGEASLNGNLTLNAIGANSTNVLVEAYNGASSKKTLYFKLWAFVPPDYVDEVPNIYDTTSFQLSTDYNYPKIIQQGTVDIAKNTTATIPHELGYVPQAKVWGPDMIYSNRVGFLQRIVRPSSAGGNYGPYINSNNLYIRNNGTAAGKFYYMIFGDEV